MKLKRIAAALVLLCMVFCMLPPVQTNAATVTAEGTCGDNLTWTLTSDGTLTISGTGDMVNSFYPPWYGYLGSILAVVIENGVTSIGDHAFFDCSSLTSVTIPDSVTSIGDSAFSGCSSLTSIMIPDSVTSIDSYAFSGCSSLTSVTIPVSVTSISQLAFSSCDSLTGIWVDENNPNYSSDSCGVLFSKNQTELIRAPGGISGHYTIPDSVTSIGGYAFGGCTSLSSVTIPNSVTSIGFAAFGGCVGLTSVIIPDSVTSINAQAFNQCTGLTSVTIPDSVTSIDDYAFRDCTGLTDVYISDLAAWCNLDFWYGYSNPLYYAENLYLNGQLVTDLVIPDGVTRIDSRVFNGFTGLTSVTIPDSVTIIEYGVFSGCSSLTSVTIPDSVTSIGDSVFAECRSLTGIWVDENNPNYSSDSCGVLFNKDQTELIQAPGGISGHYTIPDSVTSIGGYAFYGCSSLTSVTIPDSVTSIDMSTFRDCSSLTSVTIPDSVTSIGEFAFSGCSSLTGIWVDENNPNYSSDSCGVLFSKDQTELIQAPGGISGHYTIPDSVTSIGDRAFSNCSSLTLATIPDSVTSIGDEVFYNCSSLTSVAIPDSVTGIGNYAFSNCSSLTSVTIPDSVTGIGNCAFYNCTSLTEVIYCGTEEQWNAIYVYNGNTSLTNANRQYHDYVNGTCTVCGERDGHVHEWTDGICTGCGQELAAAIELSGDGKVTAFDAQLLAEAKAGLRQLTDEQWEALGDLQP